MEFIQEFFGLHTEHLATGQMIARACVVFFAALAFIRISGVRTLGKQTAFDQLTLLILGAILGRSIVAAEQPFFSSLLAVLVIMLLHRLIAWLTFKSKTLGRIFKGTPIVLYENGKLNDEGLKKTNITREDISESLHLFLNEEEFEKMKTACLERSGEISITRKGKLST